MRMRNAPVSYSIILMSLYRENLRERERARERERYCGRERERDVVGEMMKEAGKQRRI